jgi:hypothetical protein
MVSKKDKSFLDHWLLGNDCACISCQGYGR